MQTSDVLPGNNKNLGVFLMSSMWEGPEGQHPFVTCTFTGKLACYMFLYM